MINQIETLTSNDIMWVLIPMINPDGVFLGNNRTGFNGSDFNRFWSWEDINRKNSNLPEIFACA